MKNNIAIGIVTFKPKEDFIDKLQLAINENFKIYIFDNSPEEQMTRLYCKSQINCYYQTCGKNVGLGVGISAVCSNAYIDGLKTLLFFDQDTNFSKSTLAYIEDFYQEKNKILKNYSSITFKSNQKNETKFQINNKLLSINSGSLYILKNAYKLNWFNTSFFVDGVDYEFCLRSNNNNLKIGECINTPGFDHVTDQDDTEYSIFGNKIMTRKYSTFRFFNTIYANFRVLFISIKTLNFKYSYEIIRSLSIYLFFQILVRILTKITKTNDKQ